MIKNILKIVLIKKIILVKIFFFNSYSRRNQDKNTQIKMFFEQHLMIVIKTKNKFIITPRKRICFYSHIKKDFLALRFEF